MFWVFVVFGGVLWDILLVVLIFAVVSVCGVAIIRLICYIKTQKRVDRLGHTVGTLSRKLTDIIKEANDSNDRNLQ